MRCVTWRRLFVLVSLFSFLALTGCSSYQWAPDKMTWVPVELIEAENALNQARQEGKDAQCPNEFNAASQLMDKTWKVYWACNNFGAIDMAKKVQAMVADLCPEPPAPPPPPPPPPPAPKPEPAPEPALPELIGTVHFDFDKSNIKEEYVPVLMKVIAILSENPNANVEINGYTDWIGTEEYNLGLSERRASSVMDFLVEEGGIDPARFTLVGFGEQNPIATNKTREGRALNRRSEIILIP